MKKAFTLAEVLITLGIIGVVAAMTMPTLINSYKKQETVTKLRKIYSVLSQAVQKAAPEADYYSIPFADGSNEGMLSWYDEVIAPNIKVLKKCVYEEGCWNDGTKLLNGDTPIYDMGKKGIGGNNVTFDTPDGYFVTVDVWEASNVTSTLGVSTEAQAVVLYVDINGKTRPNLVGKDVFTLVYTVERGLMPAGKDLSNENVKANCAPNNSGMFCLEHLIREGWNIKNTNI